TSDTSGIWFRGRLYRIGAAAGPALGRVRKWSDRAIPRRAKVRGCGWWQTCVGLSMVMVTARPASAQITPAAGYTPPDDTPSIRLGVTLYPAYILQTDPNITDAGGNSVERSNFDVLRAYINVTGQLSHIVAFRITPDITRESGLITLGPGNIVS